MNSKLRSNVIGELANDDYFSGLSSHQDRLSYIVEEKLPFNKLHSLLETTVKAARKKAGKSLLKAKQFSDEADFFAKQAKGGKFCWEQALQAYKKAILHAPFSKPAFLSQLYLRKFEAHLAKKDATSTAMFSALLAVEFFEKSSQKCSTYLSQKINSTKMWIEKESKKGANSLPKSNAYIGFFIDSSCKIESSPVVGRHFIATNDIEPNQVLLEEHPYCVVLLPKYILQKCSNCHITLEHSYYPCANCTQVLFCSANCASQAYIDFHCQECGLLCAYSSIIGTQTTHIIRMIAKGGGPLAVIKCKEQFPEYSIENYLADGTQQFLRPSEKAAKDRLVTYRMSSTLVDHDEAHSTLENAYHSIFALEIATMYELASGVKLSPDVRIRLAALIISDFRRVVFNAFGWQSWTEDVDADGKLEHIAHAQCLVASLVNHSCDFNTTWSFTDNGMICFTASRTIKSGEEITISYGTGVSMPYSRRQKRLNDYFFACACSACFADACKGNTVLRCHDCSSGAVPVGTVIDRVPQLRSNCLLCFRPYSNFDKTVESLTTDQKTLSASKGAIQALQLLGNNNENQLQKLLLFKVVKKMQKIAHLSLPSSSCFQTAIGDFSKIMQSVGEKAFKDVFSFEELNQLALLVCGFFLNEKEDVLANNKEVDLKQLSMLNFWFDLSTSLLAELHDDQSDVHQKMLFSTVAIGTKMMQQLISMVDFGLDSEEKYFFALLVHSRTTAIEKTLKSLLPDMDNSSMNGMSI